MTTTTTTTMMEKVNACTRMEKRNDGNGWGGKIIEMREAAEAEAEAAEVRCATMLD